MGNFNEQMMALLSLELCKQLTQSNHVSLLQFHAFTTLLVNQNIPYDVSFASGTRKDAPKLQLTVYVSSTTSVVYNIQLESSRSESN